ncbi:AAA family ATPase [Streptomyces canus]|uniref:ATP-binding protein n=1 Tax=Streptomyces canus TaxID=58343 RepID=UPI003CF45E0B
MHTPAFAGRTGPLTAFTRALRSCGSARTAAVLYVHGPAGIGKTALLRRFAALARTERHPVVEIDAADVASASDLLTQADRAHAVAGTVLLVDDADRVRGADGALPHGLLPKAEQGTVTVVASEHPPDTAWRAAAGRLGLGLLHTLPLEPLSDAEARQALSGLGLREEALDAVTEFAHGYPLALVVAASAWREGGFRGERAPQDLVLALLDHVIGDVPGPACRQALEIAAHSRWTTEDLLRTALTEPGSSPADVFDWLRRRPFVTAERHGLSPIPLARDLLDADMRWRDPSGYRGMHERIRTHLLERVRQALPHELLPATTAFTYLHRRNGFVSRFVTWEGGDRYRETPYRREMRDDVLALVAATEGATTAAEAANWLDAQPRAFRVYWDTAAQTPAAVLAWLRLNDSDTEPLTDPLAAAAQHHARASRPLRPREHIALGRVYAPPSAHRAASALMDLVIHRILATFMLRTPAWSFIAVTSGSFLDPLLRYIDQRPVRPQITVDETSFTLYAHDWRAVTIERWMEVGHLAELAGPEGRPAARPRSGPGALTVLPREEFDTAVFDALAAWQRKDLLATNPLLRSRLVAQRGGDDPVQALRQVITEALDTLAADPRAEKYHRALLTAFLRGAPTREAAAERLGLPLSTFRRHMGRGLERVRSLLWDMESEPRTTAAGSSTSPAATASGPPARRT